MANFVFTAGFNPTFAGSANVADTFTLNNLAHFSGAEAAIGGNGTTFNTDDQFFFNTGGVFDVTDPGYNRNPTVTNADFFIV